MIANDTDHYGIERAYCDPSAAHERALRFKAAGAYRCLIEPLPSGRHIVTAWFTTCEAALEAA